MSHCRTCQYFKASNIKDLAGFGNCRFKPKWVFVSAAHDCRFSVSRYVFRRAVAHVF